MKPLLPLLLLVASLAAPARAVQPTPLDPDQALAEVDTKYAAAHPEVRAYVLHTATSFGRSGLWLNEDALSALTPEGRDAEVRDLAQLLEEGEYGRHLCRGLARASVIKDPRLLPGLVRIAAHHDPQRDYDCRPKWIAVSALARQESDDAVPLLVSLVDHGNQNTRFWARAALARHTQQDFGPDKPAWADWWQAQGHDPITPELLAPWAAPQPPPAP